MNGTTTQIGRYGEDIAAAHLIENGFTVIERNVRQGHNEIDIIAENERYILFVEVKTRSCIDPSVPSPYGRPSRAVTQEKRRHTLMAARMYLRAHPQGDKIPRMDVIEIYLKRENGDTPRVLKLNWIPNAYRKNDSYRKDQL